MNHREEASKLLAVLAEDFRGDADWAQVIATRALVHATLASLEPLAGPGASLPSSGEQMLRWMSDAAERPEFVIEQADDGEPVIIFQGDAVRHHG